MQNKKVAIMNKKYLIFVGAVLLLTLGFLFYLIYPYFINDNIKNVEDNAKGAIDQNKKDAVSEGKECHYENNLKAIEDALLKYDINICSCISSNSEKVRCGVLVEESSIYNQAVNESSINICNKIKSNEGLKSCQDVVRAKVEYMKKSGNETNVNKD